MQWDMFKIDPKNEKFVYCSGCLSHLAIGHCRNNIQTHIRTDHQEYYEKWLAVKAAENSTERGIFLNIDFGMLN